MQWRRALAGLAFIGTAACRGQIADVSPVKKVVALLRDMHKRGEVELHAERVQATTYTEWCGGEINKTYAQIGDVNLTLDSLLATWDAKAIETKDQGTLIDALETAIGDFNKEKQDAAAVHENSADVHLRHRADLDSAILASERALHALNATPRKIDQTAMLQLEALRASPIVPSRAKQIWDQIMVQVPTGHGPAYEWKGDGVLDLLQELRDFLKGELKSVKEEEQNDQADYDFYMQELDFNASKATTELVQVEKDRASALEEYHATIANHEEQNEYLVALWEYLKTFYADGAITSESGEHFVEGDGRSVRTWSYHLDQASSKCNEPQLSKRLQTREDELQMILSAIDELEIADQHVGRESFLQASQVSHASFGMLRSSMGRAGNKTRAVEFLMENAQRLNSHALSSLASQAQAAGSFDKVVNMIEHLITRLEAEASQDQLHNEYCDSAVAENEQARAQHKKSISTLEAEIDYNNAKVAELNQQKQSYEETQVTRDSDDALAEGRRENETVANNATIREAKNGYEAIERAIVILTEWYANRSSFTSVSHVAYSDHSSVTLVGASQVPVEAWTVARGRRDSHRASSEVGALEVDASTPTTARDAPSSSRPSAPPLEEYRGKQAEGNGIIGILQVISDDFKKLESATTLAEDAAKSSYSNYLQESVNLKNATSITIQEIDDELTFVGEELSQKNQDLDAKHIELDDAEAAHASLTKICVYAGVSHETRTEDINAEIEALQVALRILEGETTV